MLLLALETSYFHTLHSHSCHDCQLLIRLYTNIVNIKLEMHSIRLQCQQFKLHRCASNLLQKFVQTSIKTCCVNHSTAEVSASTNNIENQQFKAAVLQPKKQNLTLETLVLPEKAADGMVRIKLFCN